MRSKPWIEPRDDDPQPPERRKFRICVRPVDYNDANTVVVIETRPDDPDPDALTQAVRAAERDLLRIAGLVDVEIRDQIYAVSERLRKALEPTE